MTLGLSAGMAPAVSSPHIWSLMDETDFEGTLVLEQLAAIGQVESFFDAIDSDDVHRATELMKRANLHASTIATVVRKMKAGDGEH